MEVKLVAILGFSLLEILFLLPSGSVGSPLPQTAEARILEVKDEKTKELIFDSFTSGKSILYESLFPNIPSFNNAQVGQTILETNIQVESPSIRLLDSSRDDPIKGRTLSTGTFEEIEDFYVV